MQPKVNLDPVDKHVPQNDYLAILGSLRYLVDCTRPDLAYATSRLAQFQQRHDVYKYRLLRRVLRYLKGTRETGLFFKLSVPIDHIDGYSDSSWADCLHTRRTSIGYIMLINGTPVSWSSKAAHAIFNSTCEAEYVAASAASMELLSLQNLMFELIGLRLPLHLFVDNRSAISIASGDAGIRKLRHLELRIHNIRRLVREGLISLAYVPSASQLADILTKALPSPVHQRLVNVLLHSGSS